MPSSTESAKTVFGQALAIESAEQRAQFLDQACQENPELRAEVEDLLSAADRAGDFLGEPSEPVAPTFVLPVEEKQGTQIGPYKLLQQIGEGGMGVVYMAQQSEPVERRVALKIIKPGMDTRAVVARFEAEEQALAMMDHPGIARVYDAGVTDNGRPYFVMELVKGSPITTYCDEHHLTPKQRLDLFTQVCRAVQHAHQKGIIHRDLKPSNVLVAEYDDKPVPKIIDFGVAKALDKRLTDKTMFTELGQVVGTLEYMSPEQANVNQLDIDTRSDIYALGVLLYELLTGTTPFEKDRLRLSAFDELMRIIREEEPPKPSTRLSTIATLQTVAANRGTEPKALTTLLRGELDWIVMKALEKDRTRRYETASALAADVRRYLSDESVEACPPSTIYRMRKFARRNKVAITTAALVLLASLTGTAVSIWQANEAGQQRSRAEANLHLATQALDKMYLDVINDRVLYQLEENEQLVGLTGGEQQLLRAALGFYEEFAGANKDNPSAVVHLANAYERVGDIRSHLSEPDEAEAAYRQSIFLSQELLNDFSDSADYKYRLAHTNVRLGRLLLKMDRCRNVEIALNQAVPLLKELIAEQHENSRATLAEAYKFLGEVRASANQLEAAEKKFQQSLDHWSLHFATQPNAPPSVDLFRVRDWLATRFIATNRFRQARQLLREWDDNVPVFHSGPVNTTSEARKAILLAKLGFDEQAFLAQNEATESDPNQWAGYLRRSITFEWLDPEKLLPLFDRAIHENPSDASHRIARGRAYIALKQYERAMEDLDWAVEHAGDNALCYLERGLLYRELQEHDRAITDFETAIQLDPDSQIAYYQRALTYAELKDYEMAKNEIDRLVRQSSGKANYQNDIAWFLITCPDMDLRWPSKAVELATLAVKQSPDKHNYWNTKGVAHCRAGDWLEAKAALLHAISLETEETPAPIDLFPLALALWELGEKDEARARYEMGLKKFDRSNQNRPNYVELLEFYNEIKNRTDLANERPRDQASYN